MEDNQESRLERVKRHLKENRKTYFITTGIGVGCFTMGRYFRRPIVIDFNPVIQNAPVFNNHNVGNVVENTINNIGRLHKIVKRIKPDGTEEYFESVGDAAKSLAGEYGLKISSAQNRISKVANGHIPDFRGDQFVFIGTGTR